MMITVNKFMKLKMAPDVNLDSAASLQTPLYPSFALRRHVTPAVLVIYGIMANALFWGGLSTPFSAFSGAEIVMLHAYLALMGVAMAFGSTVAILLIGFGQGTRAWRALDYVAGVLNVSVLASAMALLASTYFTAM